METWKLEVGETHHDGGVQRWELLRRGGGTDLWNAGGVREWSVEVCGGTGDRGECTKAHRDYDSWEKGGELIVEDLKKEVEIADAAIERAKNNTTSN